MTRLTPEEYRRAYDAGVRRHDANRSRGVEDQAITATRETDGHSSAAEFLAAKDLGLRWRWDCDGPDEPDRGDMWGGPIGVESRWTEYLHGRLFIKPDDRPHLKAVLVVGTGWELMRVAGWFPVERAQQPYYWRTWPRVHAFVVPQRDLLPIEDLRSLLVARKQLTLPLG